MHFLTKSSNTQLKSSQKAFTMAEALIALAIMSVITTLTITTFQAFTYKKRLAQQLITEYNKLSQAQMLMIQDNRGGSLANYFTDDNTDKYHADSIINGYCKFLKCVNICSYTTPTGTCWKKWYAFDGSLQDWGQQSGAVLADGTMIVAENDGNKCTLNAGTGGINIYECGKLLIDINGFKGPNTMGRDIFRFYIGPNKLIPFGVAGDGDSQTYPFRGQQYTQKVLLEGDMNY